MCKHEETVHNVSIVYEYMYKNFDKVSVVHFFIFVLMLRNTLTFEQRQIAYRSIIHTPSILLLISHITVRK